MSKGTLYLHILIVFIHIIFTNSKNTLHSLFPLFSLLVFSPHSQTVLWDRTRNQLIKTTPEMHLIFLVLPRCRVFLSVWAFFFFLSNFWQMFYCLWRSWQLGIVVYLDGLDPRQAGSNLQWCPGRLMPNTHGEVNRHHHTTHDTMSSQPAGPPSTKHKNIWFSSLVLISSCLLCHVFSCYCVFSRHFCKYDTFM